MLYKPVKSEAWDKADNDILKLDWNEFNGLLPQAILDEIIYFYKGSKSSWYPNINDKEILELLSEYVGCKDINLALVPGSDYGHEALLKYAQVNGTREVFIYGTTYDNFRSTAHSYGFKIEYFREILSVGFDPLYSMKFKPNSVVYLCSPNNPTGHTIDKAKLSKLLSENKETLFFIDEAYIEFNLELNLVNLISRFENLFITRTFSKAWGLASFRVGYIVGNEIVIGQLSEYINIKHVNAFAKIAILWSLKNPNYMYKYVERITTNVGRLALYYREMGLDVINNFSGFILVRFKSLEEKRAHIELLRSKKIYIRDLGHLVGFEQFVRITVPHDLDDYLKRLS